jgi:predicted nucleic acid-binding protein
MASEKIVLCDTNIVIEALKQDVDILRIINEIGKKNIALSIITSAELLFGARDKVEYVKIRKYIDFLRVIPINLQICELFLNLIEKYALSHRIGIPDTFIAATALYYDIELFTLNKKDFKFIPGIKLFESGFNNE